MNLIQIQENLKDTPEQLLQSYVNGGNPEVPPYMALAEMQRRQAMDQRANQQQQAQQGPMPTVKEQIEQSAGLAGLQAKQAQQAQAQQQAPQGGPIPGGIPQPQQQPSPEQQGIGAPPQLAAGPQPTQRMAEGGMTTAAQGIENLQVPMGMFEYAEGGILGFDGTEAQGSSVPVVTDSDEEKKKAAMRIFGIRPYTPGDSAQKPKSEDPLEDPAYMEAVKRGLKVNTPEEQVAALQAARKAAGVKGEYGEEQKKRYDAEEAEYKEKLKDRGFNNFLNVMSGIGRGGLGGAAPAYLQQTAAQEAADMAQRRRLNAARGEIEGKQREEALGLGNEGFKTSEAQRNAATEVGGRIGAQQMQAAAQKQQEQARYENEVKLAKDRNASAIELEGIRAKHQEAIHALDRAAASANTQAQLKAPTAEMKELENYLAMARRNIANADKTDNELFKQFYKDKYAGYIAGAGLRGENALNVQESKNRKEDQTLKRYAKSIAKETDPQKKMELQRISDAYEFQIYGNLSGGIAQGAGGGSGRFPDRSSGSSGVTSSNWGQ
jgi:hypothetical protein